MKICKNLWIFNMKQISGHASETFRREAFKNPYEKNPDLWKRSMAPPKLLHGCTAAFRTDCQVNAPYCFEQFSHGHPGEALFETLTVLEFKDYLEIFALHPVIQKAVITYFLKAGR